MKDEHDAIPSIVSYPNIMRISDGGLLIESLPLSDEDRVANPSKAFEFKEIITRRYIKNVDDQYKIPFESAERMMHCIIDGDGKAWIPPIGFAVEFRISMRMVPYEK